MNIERFVGLAFSIGLLLLTLFVFLEPQIDYQQEQTIEVVSEVLETNTVESIELEKPVVQKTEETLDKTSEAKKQKFNCDGYRAI